MIQDAAEEKLALLLRLLGEEASASLLEKMRPERAAALRRRVESLQNAKITARKQEEVLADFERLFQLAVRGRGPRLRVMSGVEAEADDGPEPHGESAWQPFEPGEDPQRDLRRLTPHQLALCLQDEHPRTAAIVLRNLPPALAAKVMQLMPDSNREAALVQFSSEIPENAGLTREVLRATVRGGIEQPPAPRKLPDSVQRLSDLLRATEKSRRGPLIAALQTHHPETATAVLERLYEFDDIKGLDNRVIQRILGEVETSVVALALQGADADLVEKIQGNLSKRARETLRDEMEFQNSAKADAIEGARKTIAAVLAKVDQEE